MRWSHCLKAAVRNRRLRFTFARSRNYLKKLVSSFIRKYPEVTVEIHFENAATDIFAKGFDAGFRVSDILAKDMIAIKLFDPLRFVVAGSPRYFARVGRPRHPKELLSHNCVRVRTGNRIYDSWEFESKGKAFDVQVKDSLIMNDSMLALDAALDGGGLIYTSEATHPVSQGRYRGTALRLGSSTAAHGLGAAAS